MQFDFFNSREDAADGAIQVGDVSVPVIFVVNPRARRYVLRLRADGKARVTIPRRGSLRAARDFLRRHTHWLSEQLARQAARPAVDPSWRAGTEILFRGERVALVPCVDSGMILFADQRVRVDEGVPDLRPAVERHLRDLAAAELPPRVFELARRHRLTVQRVTVRAQKSRWGSCSRRATISLNWRLIQAPPLVSDYIVLHELMHLREMNHSPRFWREVEAVCPAFREAERWLKQHGAILR